MSRTWTAVYAAMTTSARCASLPDDTCRFFYTQLLLVADGHGSIDARPHVLTAKVWPLLSKPVSEVVRVVTELGRVGLLTGHTDGERAWLTIPDWDDKAGKQLRHSSKTDRRATPEFPSSPATSRNIPELPGYARNIRALPPEREIDPRETGERERVDPPRKRGRARKVLSDNPTWPAHLDTPAVRAAWASWEQHRIAKGKGPYTEIGFKTLLKPYASPAAFVADVEHSIARNWEGIHERKAGAAQALEPRRLPCA